MDQLTKQLEKDIALDQKMLEPVNQRVKQMNSELEEIKNKPGGLFSSTKKDIEHLLYAGMIIHET